MQFNLNNLKFGPETGIFILQIVRSHSLFHYIVVETLALLVDNSRAQLMDLKVDLAGGLGGGRARSLPHRDMRRTWKSEFLAEIELCLPTGCTRSALGWLARHEELISTLHLLRIEHLLICKHLLLLGIVHLLLLLHHAGVDPLAHRSALHMLLVHQVDLHLLLLLEKSLLFDCCWHRFGALRTYPAHLVLNLLGLETVLV